MKLSCVHSKYDKLAKYFVLQSIQISFPTVEVSYVERSRIARLWMNPKHPLTGAREIRLDPTRRSFGETCVFDESRSLTCPTARVPGAQRRARKRVTDFDRDPQRNRSFRLRSALESSLPARIRQRYISAHVEPAPSDRHNGARRHRGRCRRAKNGDSESRERSDHFTPRPPSDPRRSAPSADRSELAGSADAVVGQEPSTHRRSGPVVPSHAIRIRARSAERGSKEVRRHRGRCRRSRAEHPPAEWPSCPLASAQIWARSAERGSKEVRRQRKALPWKLAGN
jgi:hypothetical protein